MQQAKIFEQFCLGNGQTVILRAPQHQDLDSILFFVNSLVDEGAQVAVNHKLTREEEADWLSETFLATERGTLFFLVAESDGKIVATGEVDTQKDNIGTIGIAVLADYRNKGVGTKIMETLTGQAVALKLAGLVLKVFATNTQAIHFYEKLGFSKSAVNPKRHLWRGNFVDEIVMTKSLTQ
ncbi:MAG: GNAT family N-acetyltransferase [Candidatus Bathyarchaeota archaeon]|nr:GNAT family N-acetyltransferase [Candidatus Bathyarchaeota archaeon]